VLLDEEFDAIGYKRVIPQSRIGVFIRFKEGEVRVEGAPAPQPGCQPAD